MESKPLIVRRKLAAYYRWVKESERKALSDDGEDPLAHADWDADKVTVT